MLQSLRFIAPRAAAGALLCALGAAACSSDPTGSPPKTGISVIAAPAADSVLAQPQQALVVEVRDSAGKLRPGVVVQFTAGLLSQGSAQHPSVLVGPTAGQLSPFAIATTDGAGRAAVFVRLGQVAGEGKVAIAVPTLGFSTTATFTIRPGNPARLSLAPADSTLYVGRSYAIRSGVADTWGNVIPGQNVTLTAEGGAATLSGSTLTGQTVGRVRIRAQAGTVTGEVFASVVPEGTLLAAGNDGLYVFGTDGSDFRRVIAAQSARSPRWFPNGQQFVYGVGLSHAFVGDLNGGSRPLVTGANPLQAELWPHPSRDGQWVYFGGYSGGEFRGYPYRVRADGTGLMLAPGFTPDDFTQGHPSTSPAGDKITYFREVGHSRNVFIRVQSMLTGALLAEVSGHQPEWSHGDSIAYLDTQGDDNGPIRVMASNGTGGRIIGNGAQRYQFGIDWSPTDRWIVARAADNTGRLEIVEVATGLRLPLGFATNLREPAWRP